MRIRSDIISRLTQMLQPSRSVILMMQVFLAKRKTDGKYYAVKVLQKKVILNRKEVAVFRSEFCLVWIEV